MVMFDTIVIMVKLIKKISAFRTKMEYTTLQKVQLGGPDRASGPELHSHPKSKTRV